MKELLDSAGDLGSLCDGPVMKTILSTPKNMIKTNSERVQGLRKSFFNQEFALKKITKWQDMAGEIRDMYLQSAVSRPQAFS